MFSSTIIPTIGRAILPRAVHSVLNQEFDADDFEVIVVNDSGKPLPEEEWQKSSRVRMIETQRREWCAARNTVFPRPLRKLFEALVAGPKVPHDFSGMVHHKNNFLEYWQKEEPSVKFALAA